MPTANARLMRTIARHSRITTASVDVLARDGSRDRFPRQQGQLVEEISRVAPPAGCIRGARREPASSQVPLAIDHELHVVRPGIGSSRLISKETISGDGVRCPADREGKE